VKGVIATGYSRKDSQMFG